MSENNKSKWLDLLMNIDRRVVYVMILLAVSLPFFLNPIVDIKPTKYVQSSYDLIDEAAKLNKPILIGFDYDPSTLAELQPMAEAFLRHAFSKNVKVMGINFMINGTALAASTMDEIGAEFGKKNGEDYVFLGYLPQYNLVLLNLGDNLRKSYKKDYRGIKTTEIPMLANIRNYDDFHLVICITGTSMSMMYIVYGVERYDFNYVLGVTAVSAAEHYPYLHSGQLKGMLGGMKAAAEYEALIVQGGHAKKTGDGMRGMASQTWGHLTIIAFIVLGNILYFIKKRQTKLQES